MATYIILSRLDTNANIDPKQLKKAAMYIRIYGHCTTETLVATP